jgi:hypothetical protein
VSYSSVSTFTTISTTATLSSLTLSAGALSPTFVSSTSAYTVTVANTAEPISVIPTGTHPASAIDVRINGGSSTSVASGSASAVLALNVGANTVEVHVTAEDGTSSVTYSLVVTRTTRPTVTNAASASVTTTSAMLGATVTSDGGAPVSERGVIYALASVSTEPVIDGAGTTRAPADTAGTGPFTTAIAGLTPGRVYSFRAYATNSDGTTYAESASFTTPGIATLTSLVPSVATLSPAFTSAVTSYTMTVPYGTASLTLTPVVTPVDASIRINGTDVMSGEASLPVMLANAPTTVSVVVTPTHGGTPTTYTVVVSRQSALSLLGTVTVVDAPPTAAVYAEAGVVGVTESNVGAMNSALVVAPSTARDSQAEVQAIVTAYRAVMAVAAGTQSAGSLTTGDFLTLGITDVSPLNLSVVAAAISDGRTQVSTWSALRAAVDSTAARGLVLTGPASGARAVPMMLTLSVVDAQGRPSVLTQTVRAALTASAAATFGLANPLTLTAGTRTVNFQFTGARGGAQTVEAIWLREGSNAPAEDRTPGSFVITLARSIQTVSLSLPTLAAVGGIPGVLTSSSSSGLPVTVSSRTPAVCAVSGTTLEWLGPGSCVVRAAQPGDGDWQPAADVDRSVVVVQPIVQLTRTATAMSAYGGAARFSVDVLPSTVAWRAVSNAAWVTTTSTGVGSGAVQFTVAMNTTGEARSATLTVGGQRHTVTQEAGGTIQLRVADVRGTRVTLQWTAIGLDGVSYVVEGDVVSGGRAASIPVGPVNLITLDVPAGRFFARVRRADDVAGVNVSNEVRLLVEQPDPPSAPTGFSGVATGRNVAFSWTPTFSGGAASGYVLDVEGALTASVSLGPDPRVAFSNVPDGTYTFRLSAVNAAGRSAASEPITLTFPGACVAPAIPTWVTAGVAGGLVTVRWEPGVGGGAATDYLVTAEGVGSVPTGGARVVAGVLPAGAYRIYVQAVNPCGTSAASVVQTVVVP